MKILLSNDDGYRAPGIVALHAALARFATVEVVAPEHNNSARSNALTLTAPLYVERAENGFRYVDGTPADCIHIALTGLLDYVPDLVVSGVNNGANMGDDTIYSGTVGAAMEGYLFGVPAIAISQVDKGWRHVDDAAQVAAELVRTVCAERLGAAPWLLNVNIPNLPLAELKAPQVCRLGRRHAAEHAITMQNPRGETMYWIGGAGAALDASSGTDFDAVAHGHPAITPLTVDLTDHAGMGAWSRTLARAAARE